MKNPFEFFDKIYCINLSDRKDRWIKATEEFNKVGINPTRINGILFNEYKDRKRNACVGNHLAHAECINNSINSNAKNCLIFEDDVEFFFARDFIYKILEGAIHCLPENWGLFYLGINMDRYLAHTYSPYLAKLDGGLSTHAYAINHQLFQKLLERNQDTTLLHNDVFYSEVIMKEYSCFVTNPLLAGQRTDFSDIMGTVINSNDMFKQRFKTNLR